MRVYIALHPDYSDCVGVGRIMSLARAKLLEDLIRCYPEDHKEVPFTLAEIKESATVLVRSMDEAGYL